MSSLLQQLRQPKLLLLVVAVVFVFMHDKAGPKEITFHHAVPKCGAKLSATAYLGSEKTRSSSHFLSGESLVEHVFLLPKGEYLLVLELECQNGEIHREERTLMAENDGNIDFDFARRCACGPSR